MWRTSQVNKRAVEIQAADTRREIEVNVKAIILALERMTEHRVNRPGDTPQNEWQADARRYMKDFGGYRTIEWVGSDLKTRRISRLEQTEAVAESNLPAETPRDALEEARKTLTTTLSKNYNLTPNEEGFLVCSPVYRDGNFEGYLIGFFHTDSLLDNILSQTVKENYSIVVREGEQEIYRRGDNAEQSETDSFRSVSGEVSLNNIKWNTSLTPKRQIFADLNSNASKTNLILGVIVSLLLSLAVYLMQKARRQRRKTIAAGIDLERVQASLRESANHNRNLVEKSLGFISTHVPEGRIATINPAGARALGYEPEEVIGRLISDFAAAEDKPFVQEYFARVRRKREASAIFTLLTKSGEPRVWKCSSALFGEPGENQYVSGYAQDITELKKNRKGVREKPSDF